MATNFFSTLARGVKFDSQRIQKDKRVFKPTSDDATLTSRARSSASELDFFGFDAAPPAKSKTPTRERKISVDMVPSWAGNEPVTTGKKSKKTGSMPRRKRKLSEGALEEERLVEEERRQASLLLAPPATEDESAGKRKKRSRKSKKKKQQKEEEKAEEEDDEDEEETPEKQQAEEDEEEDDDDEENVALFKGATADAADESGASKRQRKKNKSSAADVSNSEREREEVRLFRKQMNIRVEGTSVPAPIATFDAMKLNATQLKMRSVLLHNIEASEYKEPTPIQMQAIPSLLLGRDVLATAPTGSGKTAAFAIPMLANLGAPQQQGIRAVVLSPTRELAVQIFHEFQRLSAGRKFHIVLLSKATAATMISSIKNNCTVNHDLVIATPLRLVHLVQEAKLDLSMVEMICLDEADRLFDMGFVEQIDEILAACTHPRVQRAMFSATMLQGVEEMAQSVLRDPVKISIGVKNAGASSIEQKLVFVGKEEGKLVAMKQLIQEGLRLPALLFVQNKERANELYHELLYDGINVGAVHADRTKEQRDETIRQFRAGQVWVLICTDLMSRGIDFKAVNMVINYDFPQDAVSYIHRIGRTGRGGRKGLAVTFFTEDDMAYLRTIANVMKLSGCDVPDWMLTLKKASATKRKQLLKAPPQRKRISTVSGYDLQKAHKRKMARQRAQPQTTKPADDDQ
ncbi:hypothetical protein PINS_up001465 [Pythium insidiosum]|nr:hypothetical protein PINS_up001465 [Pythium insidiosum]